MWKVVGSKNKSRHWTSQKFREELDVADISHIKNWVWRAVDKIWEGVQK